MAEDKRLNPDTPRDILPEIKTPDIFNILPLNIPRVYIIGSGPNGASAFGKIPIDDPDSLTIALNGMIAYPKVWDMWLCFDQRVVELDWWVNADVPDLMTTIFSSRLVNRMCLDVDNTFRHIKADYYFKYYPHITKASFIKAPHGSSFSQAIDFGDGPEDPRQLLKDGYLRGGLTVAGCALQLAYYAGCKEAVLVGIDMAGKQHWDGHENVDDRYEGTWEWADKLTLFCHRLEDLGMKVYTASPTKLHVQEIEL